MNVFSYKQSESPHLPQINHEIQKTKLTKHKLAIDRVDQPKDRIFKGFELSPHEFPWMVKIKVT